jgi:hypothetical protein
MKGAGLSQTVWHGVIRLLTEKEENPSNAVISIGIKRKSITFQLKPESSFSFPCFFVSC